MPSGQIYAAGGAVRGKSVGSDLKHWREYASRNNKIPKGKTAENPGVPLSEPTHKAVGAKAKGRADRAYAKGGKVTPKVVKGVGNKITAGSCTGVNRIELERRQPRFR